MVLLISLRFYGPVNCTEGMPSASVKHFHTTPVLAKDLVHVRSKCAYFHRPDKCPIIVKQWEWPSNKDMIHLNENYSIWGLNLLPHPPGQSHVTNLKRHRLLQQIRQLSSFHFSVCTGSAGCGSSIGSMFAWHTSCPVFGLVWFLFYGPSTHFRSFRARSVNLATLFLGKPPKQFTST